MWLFDGTPREKGWHAVSICYEPIEGIIPAAAYWDGVHWNKDYILAFHDEVFENAEVAKEWAYDHDIEA